MKRKHLILLKWFFLLLFSMYVSGISLFTHRHVINNVTYVHSHPFKRGETTQHEHTGKQICLLDQLFKTTITSDIIPHVAVSCNLNPLTILYPGFYEAQHPVFSAAPGQLRAPPTAA
ncbi:MAG: hypothetical protein ITG04_06955 [Proteiniphilum sp.]|nr:hypothetical protein [Proteiniphilum sp.]